MKLYVDLTSDDPEQWQRNTRRDQGDALHAGEHAGGHPRNTSTRTWRQGGGQWQACGHGLICISDAVAQHAKVKDR